MRGTYGSENRRKVFFIILFAILAAAMFFVTLGFGVYDISLTDAWKVLVDCLNGAEVDEDDRYYIMDVRVPRAIGAVCAGVALAVAGVVMQDVFKNPLADPYTMGVSSGAFLGAVIYIIAGITLIPIPGVSGGVGNAFLFSLIPTAILLVVSVFKKMSPTLMILTGIAIMFVFNSICQVLMVTSDAESLASAYEWRVGTMARMRWDYVPVMIVAVAILSVLIWFQKDRLNVMYAGDKGMQSLGEKPLFLRLAMLTLASLLTAAVVAFTGTIGFIGLVGPHIARIFVGSNNKYLIPASAAFGAAFVLIADSIAKISGINGLPVGVICSMVGGPLFIIVLIRQRKSAWLRSRLPTSIENKPDNDIRPATILRTMPSATVGDYMVRDVMYVSPEMTVREVKEKMIASNFHGFPVVENGYLLGYVTAKELLRFMDTPDAKLRSVMSRGTLCVIPSMSLDDATRVLFRYGLRNLPVVDEEKRLVGIISNIDIVRSQIERARPGKVMNVKKFLEEQHHLRMRVYNADVPIDQLIPTQKEVYMDELMGRQYEIKRGLNEPLIVIKRRNGYLVVDGHHRVMAAHKLGMKTFKCVVLEPNDLDVQLGLEVTAQRWGLHSLDDVKIIEGSKHPFMEVTTMLMPKELGENINKMLLERSDDGPGMPSIGPEKVRESRPRKKSQRSFPAGPSGVQVVQRHKGQIVPLRLLQPLGEPGFGEQRVPPVPESVDQVRLPDQRFQHVPPDRLRTVLALSEEPGPALVPICDADDVDLLVPACRRIRPPPPSGLVELRVLPDVLGAHVLEHRSHAGPEPSVRGFHHGRGVVLCDGLDVRADAGEPPCDHVVRQPVQRAGVRRVDRTDLLEVPRLDQVLDVL